MSHIRDTNVKYDIHVLYTVRMNGFVANNSDHVQVLSQKDLLGSIIIAYVPQKGHQGTI